MSNLPRLPDYGTTEASVFLQPAAHVPSFAATPGEIYEYVERKAGEVGAWIKRNRGVPGDADPDNMLSVEEKAIAILGAALGVPDFDVMDRINAARVQSGLVPMSRGNKSMSVTAERHSIIVAAVREDVMMGMEQMSPLVVPQQRIHWRASLLEYYRRKMMDILLHPEDPVYTGEIDRYGDPIVISTLKAVIIADKAMQPHLRFFDKLAKMGIAGGRGMMMPSQQIRAAREADTRAEQAINKQFEDGKITEEQRLEMLREIRHGVDEENNG